MKEKCVNGHSFFFLEGDTDDGKMVVEMARKTFILYKSGTLFFYIKIKKKMEKIFII